MNAQQIQLVKDSWNLVTPNADAAGQAFYARLFEVAPSVRPMFKGDVKEQSRKLMMMITYVISKLDRLDMIVEEIKALAKRHDKYGAKRDHYAVVGQCLIHTLKSGLGAKWTAELEAAWITVFTVLAEAMIANQEQPV